MAPNSSNGSTPTTIIAIEDMTDAEYEEYCFLQQVPEWAEAEHAAHAKPKKRKKAPLAEDDDAVFGAVELEDDSVGEVDWGVEAKPLESLYDGLLYFGQTVLLAADEGDGKSLVVEALSVCARTSLAFGDRPAVKQRLAVLLIDGQLGANRLRRRFSELAVGYGTSQRPLVRDLLTTPTVFDLTDDDGRDCLARWVERAEAQAAAPLGLLVIDAREQAVGSADLNNPTLAQAFFDNIKAVQGVAELRNGFAFTALVTTNLRKVAADAKSGGGANWLSQRISGHARWKDLADTICGLRVRRAPGSRLIDGVTLWAAKDRDAVWRDLDLDLENTTDDIMGSGWRWQTSDPALEAFVRSVGRPNKGEAAKAFIVCELATAAAVGDGWVEWRFLVAQAASSAPSYSENVLRQQRDRLKGEHAVEVETLPGKPSRLRLLAAEQPPRKPSPS